MIYKPSKSMELPYHYTPRKYQYGLYNARDDGFNRIVSVIHRRAGKDVTCLNIIIGEMFKRVGTYWYVYPEYSEARKAIWEGMEYDGFKFMDHFPKELVKRKNNSDMFVEAINGSMLWLCGSDKYHSLLGTNPVGVIFSEYSQQNPMVWDKVVSPILLENEGWAIFNYTPYGHNHGYTLHNMAKYNDDWYCTLQTVEDTYPLGGRISPEMIESERKAGRSEELIQQEYFCNFDSAVEGAYYANELRNLRSTGRLRRIPIESTLPVHTFWDLGVDDSTTIWYVQECGHELRVVDVYGNNGEALVHYANEMNTWKARNACTIDTCWLPHDGANRQLHSGKSTKKLLGEYGYNSKVVRRPATKEIAIEASRQLLNRVYIDEERCEVGISALAMYKKKKNEALSIPGHPVFATTPVHNWASHFADGFQTAALHYQKESDKGKSKSPIEDILTGGNRQRSIIGASGGGWMGH